MVKLNLSACHCNNTTKNPNILEVCTPFISIVFLFFLDRQKTNIKLKLCLYWELITVMVASC